MSANSEKSNEKVNTDEDVTVEENVKFLEQKVENLSLEEELNHGDLDNLQNNVNEMS